MQLSTRYSYRLYLGATGNRGGRRGEQIIPPPFPTDQLQLQVNSDDTSHSCNFSHLKCISFLSLVCNQWRENTPTYLIYLSYLAQEGRNAPWRCLVFPIDCRENIFSLASLCLSVGCRYSVFSAWHHVMSLDVSTSR